MTLRPLLENMAAHLGERTFAGYLLKHGQAYTSAPLTPEEHELVTGCARSTGLRFQMKECYYNAQTLVLFDDTDQLRYVEGYANRRGLPVLHGWATINGKVVDLTWRRDGQEREWLDHRILGEFTWEYVGVEIPKSYIQKMHLRDGVAKSVLDDMEGGFPLLSRFDDPPRLALEGTN